MKKIILFDGECNLCNSSVQFILKREKHDNFLFASLQGDFGRNYIQTHQHLSSIDSLILIDNEKHYVKSSAALHICKNLRGMWPLLYPFILFPTPIRNYFYDIIAANRKKWFGKTDSCLIPHPSYKEKFLD